MTAFKPAIRIGEANSQGKYNIKIRISHAGKTRYLPTKHYLEKHEFDNSAGRVDEKTHPNAKFINIDLKKIILSYEQKLIGMDHTITMKELIDTLKEKEPGDADFYAYVESLISNLYALNKISSADLYKFTLVALRAFTGSVSLLFKNIDYRFLDRFEKHLLLKDLRINTVSIYLRNIRTAFNKAINEGVIPLQLYPFRRFKIKSEKTAKRSLQINILKKIKDAPLKGKQAYARDIFMFSFYLIGINTIDIYNLDKIIDERIEYRRAKTGRLYSIKLLPEAKYILQKYPGRNKLLNCSEIYNTVYNFRKAINKFLKQIATEMELGVIPTTYYARHSWATIAKKLKIDRDTIAHALGHGIDTMTDIYIDFDIGEVDRANKIVCKALSS